MPSTADPLRRHLGERVTVSAGDDGAAVLTARPARAWFAVCALLGLWAFQSAWVRYADVGPVGILGNLAFGTYLCLLAASFPRPWVRADAAGITSGLLVRRRVAWDEVARVSLAELLMTWRPSSILIERHDGEVVRIRCHSLQVVRHRKAAELARVAQRLAAFPAEVGREAVPIDRPAILDLLERRSPGGRGT